MSGKYDDIIHLPHHVSQTHPQMPMCDRAAQFSPFAALTDYGVVIRETGRRTETRPELDGDAKSELDRRIALLSALLESRPLATITYFQPDVRKEGGACLVVTGVVRKIDEYHRVLVMGGGLQVPISDLLSLDGEGLDEACIPKHEFSNSSKVR